MILENFFLRLEDCLKSFNSSPIPFSFFDFILRCETTWVAGILNSELGEVIEITFFHLEVDIESGEDIDKGILSMYLESKTAMLRFADFL